MSVFSLMQNDRLPILRAELADASGVINLTNSTCYLIYRSKYSGIAPTTGEASVITATGGVLEYAWTTGDTINPGVYYGFWRVSGSNGKFSSFPNDSYFRFIINPVL